MDDEIAAFLGICIFVLFIGGLVIYIIHLASMQSALEAVAPPARKMDPGQVWLTLIPLFGIAWQYIVVAAVADSLRNEYMRRGLSREEDRPAYSIGLTSNILWTCRIIPYLGLIPAIIGLIMRLVHLQRVNAYRQRLAQSGHWQQFPNGLYGQPYAYPQQQPGYGTPPPYGQQNPYQQPYGQQQHPPHFPPANQQQQTPPPPPQNPNDQSRWMPPGDTGSHQNPWTPPGK